METVTLTEWWIDDDGTTYDLPSKCYVVDSLPEERDYFDYGKDKGYVIQIIEVEDIVEKGFKKYNVYYEHHLDDWNNQIIDVAEVCCIATHI